MRRGRSLESVEERLSYKQEAEAYQHYPTPGIIMNYPLIEIFGSIQGEGVYTGHPVTFIRLAGCPNKCPFCDTDQTVFEDTSAHDIVNCVVSLEQSRVVLTGGEPTIHNLAPLIDELHARVPHLRLHLETSGLGDVPHFVDWISFSPKRGTPFRPSYFLCADEIKWLYPMWDIESINSLFKYTPLAISRVGHIQHFLQPINGRTSLNKENVHGAVEEILSNTGKIPFALSIQLHKIINVR